MDSLQHLLRIGELTKGARERVHGDKLDTFTEVGRRWSQHLGVEVTPQQVAICMIELKLTRAVGRILVEHLEDMAGYAGCGLEIIDRLKDEVKKTDEGA